MTQDTVNPLIVMVYDVPGDACRRMLFTTQVRLECNIRNAQVSHHKLQTDHASYAPCWRFSPAVPPEPAGIIEGWARYAT